MLKKVLLIALVGVAIGILVYFFIGTISIPNLQNIFTQAEATWSQLPSILKTIIPIIPSAIFGILTLFFAWTKTRAIQLTEQTKVQASQQLTQVQGEYNEKISVIQQENETLRNQAGTGVTELATKLSTAETTITSQQTEINRLTTRVNEAENFAHITMHPTDADMIKRLEQTGHTITKTVP